MNDNECSTKHNLPMEQECDNARGTLKGTYAKENWVLSLNWWFTKFTTISKFLVKINLYAIRKILKVCTNEFLTLGLFVIQLLTR